MARKIKKICVLCGNEHEIYCVNCREAINQPIWKNSFCCENCRDIYSAAAGYFGKSYSSQEAKALLDMCDLSNKEHFTKATQRLIDEIYGEDVVIEENKENENLTEISADNQDVVKSKSLDDANLPEEHAEVSTDSENIVMTAAYNTIKQATKVANKKKNKK